jgi:hypothetical protein
MPDTIGFALATARTGAMIRARRQGTRPSSASSGTGRRTGQLGRRRPAGVDHARRSRAGATSRVPGPPQSPRARSTGAIRRAARDRCEIAFFASADHRPSVSPPGGSDQGSKIGS